MIWENIKLLGKLYVRPMSAISGLIDEGHWIIGAILVVAISLLFQFSITTKIYSSFQAVLVPSAEATQPLTDDEDGKARASQAGDDEAYYDDEPVFVRKPLPLVGDFGWHFVSFDPTGFFTTVAGLMLLYVPATLLLAVLLEPMGSFGVVFRRDYGTLLTCTLFAWVAAHIPFALGGLAIAPLHRGAGTALILWTLSVAAFGALMILAVRVVFGMPWPKAILAVCVSWTALLAQRPLFSVVSPFLFSPFILFYAYMYLRGEIGDVSFSFRHRQNFRRFLEAATINPRDAEAHYQLGLVYLQRRQITEAKERFRKAIEIDPTETDAQFQLGRIALQEGQLPEAIGYFGRVVEQNEKHAHNEIWREIGATYLKAGMYQEAFEALGRYVERRPYDPEGLFYYGKTLAQLGRASEAEEMFSRCVEAVKTSPSYRRRQMSKWRKLAQSQMSGSAKKVSAEQAA
jgi:Flp pilus assembly protein TadD